MDNMDHIPDSRDNRSWYEKAWAYVQTRTFWRLVGKVTLWGALGLIFAGISLVVLVWTGALGPLPKAQELRSIKYQTASQVYARNGELLGKFYLVNRTEIAYEALPEHLVEALVATEDVRFYDHAGVDSRSLARVAVKSVLLGDRSSGGGSTLTQQLAKNLFGRESYRMLSLPVNKVREMFIARRLENLYTKEEILALYLNTVHFGENVYGIAAAAQRFFNTSPQKLKIEEAAVLVGMLKATTYYNPHKNPEPALIRRNVVLDQMVKYGYMEASMGAEIKEKPLKLTYRNVTRADGSAQYFRQYLAEQLKTYFATHEREDGGRWNIYTDGLKIYTTIDKRMQQYAEDAVKQHMASLQKTFDAHWKDRKLWKESDYGIVRAMKQSPRYRGLKKMGKSEEEILTAFKEPVKMSLWSWSGAKEVEMSPLDSIMYYKSFLHAGMMAMEPKTGYVRAWVGGINHQVFKYDHVTSTRQVGSTFKPFVYAAALDQGIDPCEYIPNEKVTYQDHDRWTPGNADGKYEGYYSMAGGLVNSVNTVSAAVVMKVGVPEAHRFVQRFGFESKIPQNPTLVLGTADLALKEMVSAYSAFANSGMRVKPIVVLEVKDSKGNQIVKFPSQPERNKVMEPTEAHMMAHMLRMVVDSGTAKRIRTRYGIREQIAGKTGTTQDQTDGWFMGVTPDLVVGVWVGGDERKVRFRSLRLGQGANTALPIYGKFMQKIYADSRYRKLRGRKFPEPGVAALEALDCPHFRRELVEDRIQLIEDLFDRIELYREQRQQQKQLDRENPNRQRRDKWQQLFNRKKERKRQRPLDERLPQ